MQVITLTELEVLSYAESVQNSAGGSCLDTYYAMNRVLEGRGLLGFAEKVTVSFEGPNRRYELHYSET